MEGEELPPNKQGILECVDGGLTQTLDEDNTVRFSLKVIKDLYYIFNIYLQILQTSECQMLRLLFIICYRVKGSSIVIQEKFYSSPFIVQSNNRNLVHFKKVHSSK